MNNAKRIEDYIHIPKKISRGIRTVTWESAEANFGEKFPDEFVKCIDLYGLGYFSKFLILYSPIDISKESDPLTIFASKLQYSRLDLKDLFLKYPEIVPEGVKSNPESLTLFGGTANGDQLFWLGDPRLNGWSIYVFNDAFLEFSRYDMDIENFIINLTEGRMSVRGFPHDVFASKVFEPII